MRNAHEWFGGYSADHQHPTNRVIHWICVPAILWAVIALLWLIPVPPMVGRAGFWCGLVMVAAVAFYWRLSHAIGVAMLIVFIVLGALSEWLYRALGPAGLLWLAIGVFVVAWIGQFVGHQLEGRRPSFLTDLAYLLIGPAWLTGKLLRRVGIAY